MTHIIEINSNIVIQMAGVLDTTFGTKILIE
jgi:hypothetical protein